MGRHADKDNRGHEKHKRETEEERLLRKARGDVGRNETDGDGEKRFSRSKKSGRKRSRRHHDSDEESRSGERHRKSERHHRRDEDGSSDGSDSRRHRKEYYRKKKKESKKKAARESRGKERKNEELRVKKSELVPLGEIKGSPPAEPLDAKEDYFAFHKHLWVYLYREEGVIFGDLSSEDAHDAFQRFVKRFNAGKLEKAYYDGLPAEAVEEVQTTRHNWSFKTSEAEQKRLHFLQQGVRKQTEYDSAHNEVAQQIAENAGEQNNGEDAQIPEASRRRLTPEERAAERNVSRRLRAHVRTVQDELTGGRKDGRERQIEKRQEKAATIHGAAKDRDEVRMSGIELNDEAIYGGSEDASFKDALAREKMRAANRQKKQQDRVAELKKKEQDKQDAMIKMLGLSEVKPGQKITIAPRQAP